MEYLSVEGKTVELFPAEREGAPLVILHTVQGEGEAVCRQTGRLTDAAFSLAAIGNLDWDGDMSPWPIDPLFKGDSPCAGKAEAYLTSLTGTILPEILGRLPAKPGYLALAGYSLAGLFAVYAMYHTDIFSRIASASGSFWYPDFLPYVEAHRLRQPPERIYFSLGDKEAKTRHRVLRWVEDNTRRLEAWYRDMGIETVMEMNPGNHFRDAEERMAKGIAWILRGQAAEGH